jgi:hypothetical protein
MDPDANVRVIRALIQVAIDEGDMEGASALQRALNRWEKPAPSVMMQAFDVLAVRP